MLGMTNATKAGIITFINAVLFALPAFGVPLTEAQNAGIGLVVNSGLGLAVLLTREYSHKRVPELPEQPSSLPQHDERY